MMGNETCIRSILCALNLFSAFFCIHKITRFNFHSAGKMANTGKKMKRWEAGWGGEGRMRKTQREREERRRRRRKKEERRARQWTQPKTRYDPACIQFNMPDFNLDIYLCIIFRQWTRSKKKPKLNVSRRERKLNAWIEKRLPSGNDVERWEEKKYSGRAYELWCSKSIESQI